MGGRNYFETDYEDRQTRITNKGYSTPFVHDEDIRTGKTQAGVHPTLNPYGVKIRESRDSAVHPVTLPIIMDDDTTGSMRLVPEILQRREKELMGYFLKDKASGKKYIRDAYPAIMLMGTDDYEAQLAYGHPKGNGALQVGQFESDIAIDVDLGNLWLTQNGGGNRGESYDLALYFAARHTVHDHWEKRHRKGYMFIFGDEPLFSHVNPEAVKDVIGDDIDTAIPIASIIQEVKKRYHLVWGVPIGHEHTYPGYMEQLKKLLGAERVRVFDPEKVCEFIVSTVALIEGATTIDDLITDGVVSEKDRQALVPLAHSAVATVDLDDLPEVAGAARATERI